MTSRPSLVLGWTVVLAGAVALAAAPVATAQAKPAAAVRKSVVRTIAIADMKFGPAPAGLKVGDTVEWVNNDIFVHSATARDKSFDLQLKPKAHMRLTLTKPGAIAFYCRYHPSMTGTLVVAR
jgi:plastocyanin